MGRDKDGKTWPEHAVSAHVKLRAEAEDKVVALRADVARLRAALDSIRAFASERTHSIYCEHIAEMAAEAVKE